MKHTNTNTTVSKENTLPYMLFVATETNKAFKEIKKNNEEAKAAFKEIGDIATRTTEKVAECFRK